MSAEYLLLKLCTGCEGGRCVGRWALGSILSGGRLGGVSPVAVGCVPLPWHVGGGLEHMCP